MLRRLSSKKELSSKQVFAKFLDFLQTSEWAVPVETFIEHKSTVFDRQQGIPNMYEQIHAEFASMIDMLIAAFCEDIRIRSDQFVAALKDIDTLNLNVKQRSLLEPVSAAHDLHVFIPMMMRKNVELQLQALQMIEFMCGLIPSVLQLKETDTFKERKEMSAEETEQYVLMQAIIMSKEEYDRTVRNEMELQHDLAEIARNTEVERTRLEGERRLEQQRVRVAMEAEEKEEEKGEKKEEPKAALATQPVTTTSKGMYSEKKEEKEKRPLSRAKEAKDDKKTGGERPGSRRSSIAGMGVKPSDKEKEKGKEKVADRPPSRKNSVTRNGAEKEKMEEKTEKPAVRRGSVGGGGAGAASSNPSKSPKQPRTGTATKRPPAGPAPTALRVAPSSSGLPPQQTPEELLNYGPTGKSLDDVNALLRDPSRIASADVRARAEYLKMQRDRLAEKKREERQRQFLESSRGSTRPSTAKARGALRGERTAEMDMAEARRTLAQKLKQEVMADS